MKEPSYEDKAETGFNDIIAKANERLNQVYQQREEVLEAFVAKYGFEPDRFIQVEQRMPTGFSEWSVRRRSDEEMEQLSRMSAQL